MAKDGSKKDPIERARRKLTKAQMELSVAEEEHAQARVRGKQEIEQARLRAAKWLTKTGKRVDRRAATVTKTEDRLAALLAGEGETAADAAPDPAAAVPDAAAAVPDAAGDEPATPGLRRREQQALDALQSVYGADGATATEWQAASKMSEATFLRARKVLTDRGLVLRDSDARRGAHYRIQEHDPA